MSTTGPTLVGTLEPPPPPVGPIPVGYGRRPSRPLAVVLMVLIGLWTVGLIVISRALGWFVGEVFREIEEPAPGWLVPAVALAPALLAALPALLLALLSPLDFARWAGRGWTVAALAGGALGLLQLIPLPFQEVYAAALALVAGGAAVFAPKWRVRAPAGAVFAEAKPANLVLRRTFPPGAWLSFISLAAGLASLIPWLWVGALGGTLETVLCVAAALAVGWFAARWLWPLTEVGGQIRNRWGRTATTGLVVGVGLTSLAAGVGQPGIDVLALIVLPPLGFVAAALARPSLTLLVGVAAIGPLAFVDSEETTLLLGTEDVGYWALVASAASLLVAWVLAVPGAAIFGGRRIHLHTWLAALVAGAMAVVAAVVYIGPGLAGFHGERLFVVMKEQADLRGLDAITDRTERVGQTYRRLVDTANRSQASIRRQLDGWGLSFRPYYLVNGLEVDGGQAVRLWLSRRGDVDRVLLNPELRPIPRDASVLRGNEPKPDRPPWNLTKIGADRVWQDFGVTGDGIVVGGSDSGVDGTHPALRLGFRGGDDSWLDPWSDSATPVDHNGHGTHTLATAVGDDVGVAPGAQWVACVNLPRNFGNPADYLTCLQFMLAPYSRGADPLRDGRPERAPQVLTNSWGCPTVEGCDRRSLQQAVAALTAAGIFFVAAAGNSGPFCGSVSDPPSTYPETLTVGAVDEEDGLTDFSSRGPAPGGLAKPDLVAPGQHILSALPGGGYGYLDGTSMATPHVAGVVALMWSANPRLIGDIARTTEILRRSTTPVQLPKTGRCGGPAETFGAGEIDAYAAVTAARSL